MSRKFFVVLLVYFDDINFTHASFIDSQPWLGIDNT